MGGFGSIDFGGRVEEKNLDKGDDRRRNSLAFYISQFVEYDKDDFGPLVEIVKKDKYSKTGGKPPPARPSKFSKIADAIIQGNMRECRNQVIVFFKTINRRYKEQQGNTLLHFACSEGYYNMVTFMANPANHSDLDKNELEISPKNDKGRSPLFLCFTPPTATYLGLLHGVDANGGVMAEKPDDLEVLSDWLKPGGPRSREDCIKFLIENGQDVNEKDFQDFTALHFAAIWGWNSTVRILLKHNADINALTATGKSALMFAVMYHHEGLVALLATSKGILIDQTDNDGYTAMLLAADEGDSGLEMMKTLLDAGADPNWQTNRRRTALKIACGFGSLDMINMCLDYKCTRRPSAFNLLKDDVLDKVTRRINMDEKKEKEEQERLDKERGMVEAAEFAKKAGGKLGKNPWGAWVEYREKKTGNIFYYNPVTRRCQRDKPKDFKPDKTRIVPEAIYGLNFYH